MATRITLVTTKWVEEEQQQQSVDTNTDIDELGESINRAMRDGQMVRVEDTKGRPHWINPANIVEVTEPPRSGAHNPNDVLNKS
jgi:hypothetical protein